MFLHIAKVILFACVTLLHASAWAAAVAEYPLFSRIEGFEFESNSKAVQFSSKKFRSGAKSSDTTVVEGKFFDMRYRLAKGREAPGSLHIIGNLVAATEKAGGKVLYQTKNAATLNLQQSGKDIWVDVSAAANGNWYYLRIIEKGELAQEVKVNPVLDAIDKTGKATVYINFDTASSKIRPDSVAVIDDILAMLRQRGDLKISVEGHTDGDGNATSNQKLSEERAAAVVVSLVKGGIQATRLSSKGFGMSKPVADNKSEEGKAKNRRVELVKLN